MKLLSLKALGLGLVLSNSAFSDTPNYSNFYVFGDSLSDNGNLAQVQPIFPYTTSFTNGQVAVEYLADELGVPLIPSGYLVALAVEGTPIIGTNFAVGGARALDNPDAEPAANAINLSTQVNVFLQSQGVPLGNQLDPAALYFVGVGGNDIRDARAIIQDSIGKSGGFFARFEAYSQLADAVEANVIEVGKLASFGAKNIVVMNAPDIGLIPESDILSQSKLSEANNFSERFQARYLPQTATNLTKFYNAQLSQGLKLLQAQFPDSNIIEFDLFALEKKLVASPVSFGFSEIDLACANIFTGGPINDPTFVCPGFLYFDEIHPTTQGHSVIAQGLLEVIQDDD